MMMMMMVRTSTVGEDGERNRSTAEKVSFKATFEGFECREHSFFLGVNCSMF